MIAVCYSIFIFLSPRARGLHGPAKFQTTQRSYDVMSIFQDGGHGVAGILPVHSSGCGFSDGNGLRRSKSVCVPNLLPL